MSFLNFPERQPFLKAGDGKSHCMRERAGHRGGVSRELHSDLLNQATVRIQ